MKATESRSCSELYDRCSLAEWTFICGLGPNYHELIKTALELYVKEKLDCQRKDMFRYATLNALKEPLIIEQYNEFKRLFHNNGINPKQFCADLYNILNKKHNKINSLRLIGRPNTGKTLIANCIVAPFICCYMNNHGSENEFFISNMLNKAIILCEELYLTVATAEDFKSILGGQNIDIAKKFNEKQLMMRTPIIITSNYDRFGRGHLPPCDESALCLRCKTYVLNSEFKPDCQLSWQQFYHFLLSEM